jgi:hypothetical protein
MIGREIMKCFAVTRMENADWGDITKVVVVAKDEKHAERLARITFDDLRKTRLKVEEVNIESEKVLAFDVCDEWEIYTPKQ